MIVSMHLNEQAFRLILNGNKIYEVRVNDPKRRKVSIGDRIDFYTIDESETFSARVIKKDFYKTFYEMAKSLDPTQLGFDESATPEEVADYYSQIYSKEEEARFGVVAFKILI